VRFNLNTKEGKLLKPLIIRGSSDFSVENFFLPDSIISPPLMGGD
jgi:hypothetical protein